MKPITTERAPGRVLIIDNHAQTADMMTHVLEDAGYHVLVATGDVALRLACETFPDVILLDIDVVGTGEVAMSHQLRRDPRTTHIPLVLMTPLPRMQEVADSMPVDDRLAIPCHFGDLYAVVARWSAKR